MFERTVGGICCLYFLVKNKTCIFAVDFCK
jgi:hypothetical protein